MEKERLERKAVWAALFILAGFFFNLLSNYALLDVITTPEGTWRIVYVDSSEIGIWAGLFSILTIIFTLIPAFFFLVYLFRLRKYQRMNREKNIDFKDVLYYFALYQIGTLIFGLLFAILLLLLWQELNIGNIVLLVIPQFFMLVSAFYVFRGRLREIGFVKPQKWALFIPSLLIFAILYGIWGNYVNAPLVEWLNFDVDSWRDNLINEMALNAINTGLFTGLLSVILIGLFVPIAEEIMFRGVLQTKLSEKFGHMISILLTSLLFAIFHIDIVAFSSLFVAGLMFGWLRYYFNSIWPPILLHILMNTVSMLIIYFQ